MYVQRKESGDKGIMKENRKGVILEERPQDKSYNKLKDANVESCQGDEAGVCFFLHVREGASWRLVADVPRSTTSNQVTHLRSLTSFQKL